MTDGAAEAAVGLQETVLVERELDARCLSQRAWLLGLSSCVLCINGQLELTTQTPKLCAVPPRIPCTRSAAWPAAQSCPRRS